MIDNETIQDNVTTIKLQIAYLLMTKFQFPYTLCLGVFVDYLRIDIW